MKNIGYGRCMPHCDPIASPDWLCEKRELPSERRKVTCDTLRTRTNLHRQPCGTLASAGSCATSFSAFDGVYQPCKWDAEKRACETTAQRLECDCALLKKGCPQHAQSSSAANQAAGDTAAASADLTGLEVAVAILATIIICCGCCGCYWLLWRGGVFDQLSLASQDAAARGSGGSSSSRKPAAGVVGRKVSKQYARADRVELSNITEELPTEIIGDDGPVDQL